MFHKSQRLRQAAILVALITALITGCGSSGDSLDTFVNDQANNGSNPPPNTSAPIFSYRVINTYPHQTDAFTQGLLYANNRLYESNGLVGQSNLREVDLTTGNVLREVDNDPSVFAEGLALRAGRLYQLTLNSGTAYLWNQNSFNLETTATTPIPAWGLTYIAQSDRFAFSDGSAIIRYVLPDFQETGRITVTDNGAEVDGLNELEFVDGTIFANRFPTNEILAINPNTGVVIFRVDLTGIIDRQANNLTADDVPNGIAFDPSRGRLFVTGKRWPFLYEIEVLAN